MSALDNPSAFGHGDPTHGGDPGMTLRDWFAGQALANPNLCNGICNDRDLQRWFGEHTGIERWEIVAAQAREFADAMLLARKGGEA